MGLKCCDGDGGRVGLGVGPPPMGVKDLSLIGVDGVGVEGEFKEKRLWWRQRDDVDMEREGGL